MILAARFCSQLWSGYALPTPRAKSQSPAFSLTRQEST